MNPLFESGPVIDKHIEHIIKIMLQQLSNNNPKKDSKCYLRVVGYINELYNGDFLKTKRFDNSKDKQFNMTDTFQKVQECKYNWNKVRQIVSDSLNHLEEAKKPQKLPWNKKYVNEMSFARFFNNGYNENGEIDCPFLHFVNPPIDSYAYKSDITINTLKENCNSLIRSSAEKFCKKYFKMKNYQLSFWYNMEDWTRWLKLFKFTFPTVYSEFVNSCEDGNPFIDFKNYLMFVLKQKEGEHPVINHWYFKLTYSDGTELDGYFKQWLRAGIDKGKFNVLKQLPRSIDKYYTDESFNNSKIKTEKKKEVVELEDVVIW